MRMRRGRTARITGPAPASSRPCGDGDAAGGAGAVGGRAAGFLGGRGRYGRCGEHQTGSRNGYERGRLRTAEDFVDVAVPQVRGTSQEGARNATHVYHHLAQPCQTSPGTRQTCTNRLCRLGSSNQGPSGACPRCAAGRAATRPISTDIEPKRSPTVQPR
jgi:hypothetical protein